MNKDKIHQAWINMLKENMPGSHATCDKNGMSLRVKDIYRTFLYKDKLFAHYCRDFILENQNIECESLILQELREIDRAIKEGFKECTETLGPDWKEFPRTEQKERPKIRTKR